MENHASLNHPLVTDHDLSVATEVFNRHGGRGFLGRDGVVAEILQAVFEARGDAELAHLLAAQSQSAQQDEGVR